MRSPCPWFLLRRGVTRTDPAGNADSSLRRRRRRTSCTRGPGRGHAGRLDPCGSRSRLVCMAMRTAQVGPSSTDARIPVDRSRLREAAFRESANSTVGAAQPAVWGHGPSGVGIGTARFRPTRIWILCQGRERPYGTRLESAASAARSAHARGDGRLFAWGRVDFRPADLPTEIPGPGRCP